MPSIYNIQMILTIESGNDDHRLANTRYDKIRHCQVTQNGSQRRS